MRTTIDIPDSLYRKMKVRAAGEGRSIKDLVLRSVQAAMEETNGRRIQRRVQLPLIRSRHPGTLDLDNKKIYDLIGFP